ncbi:MAG: hypothetical protein P8104_11515, partial [Gammaproteobacteria bacterium]
APSAMAQPQHDRFEYDCSWRNGLNRYILKVVDSQNGIGPQNGIKERNAKHAVKYFVMRYRTLCSVPHPYTVCGILFQNDR